MRLAQRVVRNRTGQRTCDVSDFPKLHSPFEREENENGEYVLTGETQDGYEWVFEDAERSEKDD